MLLRKPIYLSALKLLLANSCGYETRSHTCNRCEVSFMLELMLGSTAGDTATNISTANVVYAIKRTYTTDITTASVVVAKRNIKPSNVITANVILATRRN